VECILTTLQASEAWQAYVQRKKKAFEQRGDVAATAWAEVQRHEMQVKARQMAKQKVRLVIRMVWSGISDQL
jgi:hypothetical protein